MDDPQLDDGLHRQALQGLRRINCWSRTEATVWRAIQQAALPEACRQAGRPLRLLDIASGGGDLAVQLARRFRQQGLAAEVDGCDISPLAVRVASERAQQFQLPHVRFFQHNVLTQPLPAEHYDVALCSLFLHHLDENDALRLLQAMQQTSRQLVLVDDLRRTALGYGLAWLGCRILSRSRIVHLDGPVSVAAAFTPNEARQLAERAGLKHITVTTHWPQRFLLTGSVRT